MRVETNKNTYCNDKSEKGHTNNTLVQMNKSWIKLKCKVSICFYCHFERIVTSFWNVLIISKHTKSLRDNST